MTGSSPAAAGDAIARPPLRATAVHATFVTFGEALLRAANFAIAIYIARAFSPSILGIYANAIAIATITVTLADGGMQLSSVKRVSEAPFAASSVASEFAMGKLMLLPVAVVIAVVAFALQRNQVLWTVAALVFARVVLQSCGQMNFAILKGLAEVPAIAAIQIGHFALLALTIAAMWLMHASLDVLLVGIVVCQALEWAASAIWLRHRSVRLMAVSLRRASTFVRESIPVGVTSMIATFVLRLDLIIVSAFVVADRLGQFAAAQLPITAMYLVSALFGSIFLPHLNGHRGEFAESNRITRQLSRWVILISVPVTVAVVGYAPILMRVLFGPSFAGSARLVAILFVATPFVWLNALYLHRAISIGDQRTYLNTYAAMTAVAVAISVVMGWRLGALGVAIAVVVRECGLFAVLARQAERVQA